MEAFRHDYADINDLGTDDALDIETFEAGLHGSIVLPGSPDYDLARQVHDAAADGHPALIVRAADAQDVARPSLSPANPACGCRPRWRARGHVL